jgi:ABC-type multidrug transport system fused ATPase/permease subunit
MSDPLIQYRTSPVRPASAGAFFRALSYFRDDLRRIILHLVSIVLQTVVGLLQPFPLAILIDSVVAAAPSDHWIHRLFFKLVPTNNRLIQIIALAGATLLLRLFQELLSMYQTLLRIRIGYAGLMRVRCDLFRKLQALSASYHKSQPQGDAIYRVSYDTFGFQTMLSVATGVLLNALTLVMMGWVMLSMNWKLTLVALSIAPLLFWTIKKYGKVLEEKSTAAHEKDTELTTALQRSVATIGLMQAFGREADEYARFHNTARNSVEIWLKLHWEEVVYWLLVGMIFALGGAMIFGYGGYLIYKGVFSVGALYVFLAYLTRLYEPLSALSGTGASAAGGMAGVKRVFEVLDLEPVIRDAPDAISLPRQPRVLELDHVGFEYRSGEPVVEEVCALISPGEMVAFVGTSGVGKTTLLSLLPRFYDPTSGAVRLDGHDLRKIKLRDLRQHIAVVVQENVILPTSVAENIAYGRPDATDEQVRRAAELAGAAAFIEKLPEKYETQVSESGQNLSGGQRQRIAIARALLTEAPIMILDEPTSALDPQHEQLIIETLRGLKRQRTIIVVSHRLSTVADCDTIYVMDGGRIIERGSHAQLLARRGLYYQMARHQLKLEDSSEAAPDSSKAAAAAELSS